MHLNISICHTIFFPSVNYSPLCILGTDSQLSSKVAAKKNNSSWITLTFYSTSNICMKYSEKIFVCASKDSAASRQANNAFICLLLARKRQLTACTGPGSVANTHKEE